MILDERESKCRRQRARHRTVGKQAPPRSRCSKGFGNVAECAASEIPARDCSEIAREARIRARLSEAVILVRELLLREAILSCSAYFPSYVFDDAS